MLKTASSFVLGRPVPCDVPKGYDSVAGLPAALLEGCFEHPVREISQNRPDDFIRMYPCNLALGNAYSGLAN